MKKITIIIGIALICLGGVGTFNAVNSFGKQPVEKKDITTEGYVTDLTESSIKHQVGITISTTYRMKFAFEAVDGKFYHGEEIIEKHEIGELAEGRPITIQYHSNNPNINAAPAYGAYTSLADLPQLASQSFLSISLGTIAVGIAFVLCAMYLLKSEVPTPITDPNSSDSFATQSIAPTQNPLSEEDAEDYSNLTTARLLMNRPTE